jgi:hypothetical protein
MSSSRDMSAAAARPVLAHPDDRRRLSGAGGLMDAWTAVQA